jgi:hypothetical protein
MRIQFTLPFKEAKKLPEEQMLKIVKVQAKRLRLAEFEIRRLIQMCTENHCLDKGLGVLYEFSGYIDRIVTLIERRKKYAGEVASHWNAVSVVDNSSVTSGVNGCFNGGGSLMSSDSSFMKTISKLAETTAKLLHAIAMWRKLNWNPRPIYCDIDPNDPLTSILPTLMNNPSRPTVQNVLKEEAYKIMSSAQDHEIDMFSFVPLGVLVVLLSPVMDVDEFQSILKSRSGSNSALDTVRSFDDPGSFELTLSLTETCHCVRSIISFEDRIERVWSEVSLGRKGLDSVNEIIEKYPIIRIPYNDVVCEYEHLAWFGLLLTDYSKAIQVIAMEIMSGSMAPAGVDSFPFSSSLETGMSSSLIIGNHDGFGDQNLSQMSVMESENMLEEYSELDGGTLDSPFKVRNGSTLPAPLDSRNGGRDDNDGNNDKIIVIAKSQHIPLVRRVRQNGTMLQQGQSSNGRLVGEGSTGVGDDGEEAKGLEKGTGAVNVVMAAAKISRKLAITSSKKAANSNSAVSSNEGTVAEAKVVVTQPPPQSARPPSTLSPAAAKQNPNSASRARKQPQQQTELLRPSGNSDSMLGPVSTPSLSRIAENVGNVDESGRDRIKSAPVERTLFDPRTMAGSSLKSKSTSNSTIPTVPSTPMGLQTPSSVVSSSSCATIVPTSVPVIMSPTNLYQFQNGTFIPVVIQPTIPMDGFTAQQDTNGVIRFPPMSQMYNHNTSNSSIGSVGSIGVRTPSQSFDYATSQQALFKYGHQEDEYSDDGLIIQRTPSLLGRAVGTPEPSSSMDGNLQRGGSSNVHGSPLPIHKFPSSSTLPSRQSSMNSSFVVSGSTRNLVNVPPHRPTSSAHQRGQLEGVVVRPTSNSPPNDANTVVSVRSSQSSHSAHSGHSGSTPKSNRKHYTSGSKESSQFTSKSLASFGILSSLASVNYMRGQMLVDSQVVSVAFRHIDMGGGTIVHLAARKIAVWWKFVYPRYRFLRRMQIKNYISDYIIADMINAAVSHSIVVRKRRHKFLREGGATKIQRAFRHFRDTVLAEEKALEIVERKQAAVKAIAKLGSTVLVCILIHRYLKRAFRKPGKRKQLPQHSQRGPHSVKARVAPSLRKVCEIVFLRVKDVKLREALEHIQSNSKKYVTRDNTRAKAYQEREKAAVRLQNIGRVINSKKVFSKKKFERKMKYRILSFFVLCHYKFKKEKLKYKAKCASNIQRVVRGMLVRIELTRIVRAGMMLNSLWRKHRAFRTLKQNLRRVEKPVNIVLQKLRNIPAQLIHTEQLKIKVSFCFQCGRNLSVHCF